MNFRVLEDWQATYAHPIHVEAGDVLFITGRQDNWESHIWLWVRSAGGLEGWMPDIIVNETKFGYVATEEYTAAELTCRRGQVLVGEKETHGWVFCRSADGAAGWVPRKNLAPDVS